LRFSGVWPNPLSKAAVNLMSRFANRISVFLKLFPRGYAGWKALRNYLLACGADLSIWKPPKKQMSTSKHFTISERRARALLAAWNSASVIRVQEAIAQAVRNQDAPCSWSETERIEMVQEIAATIQSWMSGRKGRTDLDASIELLRHLAGASVALHSSAAPLLFNLEVVRLEMLASVPR
jgi:hypothetical protein